ncbi:MAG: carbohydrate ABC transporter permease [Candidatus Bipolaricaulaceae bacterium]
MRRALMRAAGYIPLLIFAAVFLAPVVVMVVTSLKANESQIMREMASLQAFWTTAPSLANYQAVLTGKGLGATPWVRFLLNTVLIVGSIVVLGILVNSMAAFALSRLRFRGRGLVVSLVVALIILPFEGLAVPLFLMVNRLGWFDSYHVQIVPFIAHPFSIFLFYQFFNRVPRELDEAAKVDGASWWQVYRKIILPVSLPVIATVAILQSLEYWNSFLWPLMVTRGPDYRPLSVAMNTFFGQPPRSWGDIMAFAFLTALPLLVLYLVFQRWFVRSVAQSGLKG